VFCYFFILVFFPKKKKTKQAKKKAVYTVSALGRTRTVLICSQTVKLHLFTGIAEE